MARLTSRNGMTIVVSVAVAAMTAAVMAVSPALAGSSAARATPAPVIISGSRAAVILTGAATVGALPLPAGRWAVFAKADATTQGGASVQLHCQLKAGSSTDHTDPELMSGGSSAFTENIALNVVHRFARAGRAILTCNSSGVTVDMVSIKMTAIKAGTLRVVKLG